MARVEAAEATLKDFVSRPQFMESHGVIDYIEDAGIIHVTDGRDTCHLSTEYYQVVIVCD